MASLFPIGRPSQGEAADESKPLQDQGFSSFDPTAFAAFQAQQRRAGEGQSICRA